MSSIEEECDIYVPQSITRKSAGLPALTLLMRVYSRSEANTIPVSLAKAAKNLGGDKYEGEVGDDTFTPYLPQAFSRVDSRPLSHLHISFALPTSPPGTSSSSSSAAAGTEGVA